jgi:O-antigen/teichoic acid export membrane protein
MSRIRKFSKNIAASYCQLGFNTLYSLASIPLILYYLPKEEYGLWVTLMQAVGYLTLIDFGMTSAASRLLVDHKDDRQSVEYGAMVKTMLIVSLCQGIIVFVVCIACSPFVASFINVPQDQTKLFVLLASFQGLVSASAFIFRPLSAILYAFQKEYISVLTGSISLMISLPLLWISLKNNIGIYSFIYINLLFALLNPVIIFYFCLINRYLPSNILHVKVSKKSIFSVFHFGKDIFLMNLGAQLINASQLIIISRSLGLDKAAFWAVGTKIFYLTISLVCRPYGASIPGFSELLVSGQNHKLYKRFKEIVILTCSLGVFLGVSFALCNSLFVCIWTQGKVFWPIQYDVFLGLWVLLSSMQTTHGNFVSVTKQIGGMRYIYLLEGLCLFLLGSFTVSYLGILGVIISSLLCTIVFTYQYSIRKSAAYFHENTWNVAVSWIKPSLKYALLYIPAAYFVWLSTRNLPVSVRFGCHVFFAVSFGLVMLVKLGLNSELKNQLKSIFIKVL